MTKKKKGRYIALESALRMMFEKIDKLEERAKEQNKYFPIKIGMPYLMGCGLAGGDWETVYAILEKISTEFKRDIYLYKL